MSYWGRYGDDLVGLLWPGIVHCQDSKGIPPSPLLSRQTGCAVPTSIIIQLTWKKLFGIHFLQNENTFKHIYYAPAFTTSILLFPEPTPSTAKPTTITTGERLHVPGRVMGQKREKAIEALRIRSILNKLIVSYRGRKCWRTACIELAFHYMSPVKSWDRNGKRQLKLWESE